MDEKKIVDIPSIRGKPRLVGMGIHRKVYKLKDLAIKVVRARKGSTARELLDRASSINDHNKKIRDEVNFLPDYYGTMITSVSGKRMSPIIITFHEYIRPLTFPSLDELKKVFKLIVEAYKKGYLLDWKPSNFGKKRGKIYYLDEYGVGKGLIPPDVAEDFNTFFETIRRRLKAELEREV